MLQSSGAGRGIRTPVGFQTQTVFKPFENFRRYRKINEFIRRQKTLKSQTQQGLSAFCYSQNSKPQTVQEFPLLKQFLKIFQKKFQINPHRYAPWQATLYPPNPPQRIRLSASLYHKAAESSRRTLIFVFFRR